MKISIIVAMDKNQVIGNQNKLPWHIPADLQHFKKKTLHKTILMGRKTYESIGKPLPQRRNIILTNNKNWQAPGCTIIHDLSQLSEHISPAEELMVIGGADLFKQLLPQTKRLYLTHIEASFTGDAFFPPWDESQWRLVETQHYPEGMLDKYALRFSVLERMG